MSTVSIPGVIPSPGEGTLYTVIASVRVPTDVAWNGTTATYTFTPDLTAAEQTAISDIVATFRTRDVELSVAEYQAIKADIDGLRTYNGITSPTLAQTVAATKAQNRILRALLRDG